MYPARTTSVRTEEEEEGGWIGSQDSISLGSMANGPWGDSAEALAYSRETGDTAGRHRNGSPGIEKRNASASLRVSHCPPCGAASALALRLCPLSSALSHDSTPAASLCLQRVASHRQRLACSRRPP